MRIYYGPNGREPFWNVRVRDAKKSVSINGELAHALLASAGVTINCSMSRTCMDPANAKSIGHPCYIAVFTKDRAYLVDALYGKGHEKAGQPKTAIRYCHEYADLIDMNDTGELKRKVKADPSIIEGRRFTLRAPARTERLGANHDSTGKVRYKEHSGGGQGRATMHRGALARAVKAGLVSRAVGTQLMERV